MLTRSRPVTVEEFMALPEDGNRHELVRGEIRAMSPPKLKHGFFEVKLVSAIDRHLEERARALGWTPEQGVDQYVRLVDMVAGGEVGMRFTLPDDPDQIRGADGVYIPPEQLAQVLWDEDFYFPGVPHLVIEVISASETATDVAEKVQDYLRGGARRVWCVYPRLRGIHIHTLDAPSRIVAFPETLTDDILPGFALPLNHL